jgi:cation diffusion facilitator CzcD-associated flavoprotein CzcO
MAEPSVIVVGGGAAGLSSAGALARRGIASIVLEADSTIGGTWARRYDRLRLHTVRGFSGLAHFPIPSRYPTYLTRDEVVCYLNEYIAHFRLQVMTETTVESIRRVEEGGWAIDARDAPRRHARVVVIATGQYRRPVMPPWPGREQFGGTLMHSVNYTNGAAFAGRRVLVVGAGNSGAEIATDLADHGAARVAISVRTPPPIVPRDPFGMPVQRTSILLSALPAGVANAFGRMTARIVIGDLTRYGMPAATFNPYTTRRIPLIDVGFVEALKRGRVTVRPAVERLTASGAVFVDGTEESFDAIVAATGFTTGLQSLLEAPGTLDEEGEPIGRAGMPTAYPGLYFVGFTHSLRGHLFEANLASRRLARHVAQYLATDDQRRDR